MIGLRFIEPPTDMVAFLVVNAGSCPWAIEAAHVDSVLDTSDLEATVDSARLGVPSDPTATPRVVRLQGAPGGGVVVRGRLAIVTVPRSEIHQLPVVLAAAMRHRAFSSVVLAAEHPAFLIVDVDELREPW